MLEEKSLIHRLTYINVVVRFFSFLSFRAIFPAKLSLDLWVAYISLKSNLCASTVHLYAVQSVCTLHKKYVENLLIAHIAPPRNRIDLRQFGSIWAPNTTLEQKQY